MQFLVVTLFVLACAYTANADAQQDARRMMARRILSADPSTFMLCADDSSCASKKGWKCQSLMKLCSPGNAPPLHATEGACDMSKPNEGCNPLYRCNKDSLCAFVGPRACGSENDCNANVAGLSFDCKELPKNAPGKRCWLKCSNDQQCHGCDASGSSCRIPEEFRTQIACCSGNCQRKSLCA